MNTVSEEGIAKINTTSKLVLRKRGDSAVEFYNTANRLYVLYFVEVAEIGGHRVFYFFLRLAGGKRGGAPDKEVGRMIVAVITQYLEENPDELVCFCHSDNILSDAINRIFHLWARSNRDIIDGRVTYFDGAGHNSEGRGLPISYVIINGSPQLITRRIIISQILNVGFDLLLCGVFDMGLAGASLASALSNLLAFTSLLGYMRKNSKIFRLRRPEKICSIQQYRECFSIGLPMLMSALLGPVLAFTMNSLVIGKLGADGMYFFTVYFQINGICMLALSGSNTAISNIGGILLGEEDYNGFRMLTRRIFRILIPVMATLSLLIFLFPDLLVRIYGADDSLIEQCYTPLRLMSIAFLPNAISTTLSVLYFVQGHLRLCRWIEIVTNVGYIGIIAVMGIYTPKLIWYILPVAAWLLLLVMVAMAYVVHCKNPLYAWPTLENTVPSNPAVTSSVPYTNEGVESFLTRVHPFVEMCELPDGLALDIALEELLYEVVETHETQSSKGKETFDVRIIDKEKELTVVVKSKGPLLNPIYKYADEELMDMDEGNLRRAILSRVCKNINHKYMNGVNCIYLNYNRSEE